MDDLIFYGDEQTDDVKRRKEVILTINSEQHEKFLEQQLGSNYNITIANTESEVKQTCKEKENVDLIIILRKYQKRGVDNCIKIADVVKELHPRCEVLLIVGEEDEEGKMMVEEAKKLQARTVSHESKPISSHDIVKVLDEIKASWGRSPGKIIRLESMKGGCGVTTITIGLAVSLAEKKILIIDQKNGIGAFFNKELTIGTSLKDVTHINSYIDCLRINALDQSLLDEAKQYYDYILLDDIFMDQYDERIVVMDPTPESILNAKHLDSDKTIIVLNSAMEQMMPKEMIEHEIKHMISMVIPHDRQKYFTSCTASQPIKLNQLGAMIL